MSRTISHSFFLSYSSRDKSDLMLVMYSILSIVCLPVYRLIDLELLSSHFPSLSLPYRQVPWSLHSYCGLYFSIIRALTSIFVFYDTWRICLVIFYIFSPPRRCRIFEVIFTNSIVNDFYSIIFVVFNWGTWPSAVKRTSHAYLRYVRILRWRVKDNIYIYNFCQVPPFIGHDFAINSSRNV